MLSHPDAELTAAADIVDRSPFVVVDDVVDESRRCPVNGDLERVL